MQFVRRVRMEVRTDRLPQTDARGDLPEGYRLVPWRAGRREALIEEHAAAKRDAFAAEPDAALFPALATAKGCRSLMAAIARQPLFLPGATWLVVREVDPFDPGFDGELDAAGGGSPVATVQGLGGTRGIGAVQNVGVVPECRGLGLGRAALLRSLRGFAAAGYGRVYLEVSADNAPAVRLYAALGFRPVRTVYKPVKNPAALPAPAPDGGPVSLARVPPVAPVLAAG